MLGAPHPSESITSRAQSAALTIWFKKQILLHVRDAATADTCTTLRSRSACHRSIREQFNVCTRPRGELSSRTFWTLRRSSRHSRRHRASFNSASDPGHGSARLLGRPRDPLVRAVASRHTGPRVPLVGFDDHAAASMDGHVRQAADRLASARSRRAAVARAVRSAGTASRVPKYMSSGVCPQNAE